MKPNTDVAIVGAGPYGLSIAAHLRARNVDFRIFGSPMGTWRTQMLRDMHLKSEGFASSLYEPSGTYTLKAYCAANGLPYADIGLPVAMSTFIEYGLAFQRRYVPELEQHNIVEVNPTSEGFTVRAEDGELIAARRVVVAAGISQYHYVPPALAALPAEYCSHSSQHVTVKQFAGQDVIVIGAGASALDVAKGLLSVGARVKIVARRAAIPFQDPPRKRNLLDRVRAPFTVLGPDWRSFLCVEAPLVFHLMPEEFRVRVVKRHLPAAPGWFTREPVEGKAQFLLRREISDAKIEKGSVRLTISQSDGSSEEVAANHVIAATGYKVDLARLAFLSERVRNRIKLCDTSPSLSADFESNIKGLYFVGTAAANSFGPMLRFAAGARFTAARLSRHLAQTATFAPPVSRQAAA